LFQRTQFELIFSFVGVCILIGGLSLLVGWQIIDQVVFSEAKKRIYDIAELMNLDFAGIVSGDTTQTICRLGRHNPEKKYTQVINPIAKLSYQRQAPVAAARQTIGKIFAIFFPIMGFVAMGFEHSVANMYFIPAGLFLRSLAGVGAPQGVNPAVLGWGSFLLKNLLPVTIGNIIGGGVFVGMSYWSAYLRK
jgi:hypothetical protein